jgi:hypothetical protein
MDDRKYTTTKNAKKKVNQMSEKILKDFGFNSSTTKAAPKKPAPKKPVTPRKPNTSVRKPMAAPSPTRRSGLTVVLPNGSTVGLRDLGKVKPTPKPTPKTTPKTTKMTPQDAASKKLIKQKYGW